MAAGLRERQKADRERRILNAAEHRFREHGYEDTKIETIAREAGVSVGTVYNYFDNKSDLLLTLVTIHDEFIAGEIDELIKNPPGNLVDGVCGVFFAMTRHSLDHLGKENWRNLFGLSIAQRQTMLGRRFASFNARLLDRIVRMLNVLKAQGTLAADCDTEKLGGILFRVETMHYIELASNDAMAFADYKRVVLEDMRFALRPYVALAETRSNAGS